MLMVMHPTYELRVEIKDVAAQQVTFSANPAEPYNGHKFFDGLKGKTGCDEVLAAVKDALAKAGLQADVSLQKFSHRV